MRDFPFYREIEEYKAGFRPIIENYFGVLVFAVCSMLAGTIVAVKQGPQPSGNEIAALSPEMKQFISSVHERIEGNFKPNGVLTDFKLTETERGIEIQFSTSGIIKSGQAGISPKGEEQIRQLANTLLPMANRLRVRVEGYTDDAPMRTNTENYPTNWELSGARAASVLRIFEKAGFPHEKLAFAGRGEINPLFPNRNPAGEPINENRLKNRRVVIQLTGEP